MREEEVRVGQGDEVRKLEDSLIGVFASAITLDEDAKG